MDNPLMEKDLKIRDLEMSSPGAPGLAPPARTQKGKRRHP
ncbi:MAG: hypothetical protein CM15mP18_2540 [Methanobacteriota archaeon]|nr:MAG: hypothetical protein CM15mP18_2540 [Euryarchaeota archaeon]